MGRSIRYLGAAALSVLFVAAQTDTAPAVPFDIDCGGQIAVDTASPTLTGCSASSTGAIAELTVFLETDDPGATPHVSDLEVVLFDDSAAAFVVSYSRSLAVTATSYMNATFGVRRRFPPRPRGTRWGTHLPVAHPSDLDDLRLSGD